MSKVRCTKDDESNELSELLVLEEANSWVDQLAQLVIRVPPPMTDEHNDMSHNGTENFRFGNLFLCQSLLIDRIMNMRLI